MTKKPFLGWYANGRHYEFVGPKPRLYKVDGKLEELEKEPPLPTANDLLRMAAECEPGSEDWNAYVEFAQQDCPPKKRGRPKKNVPDESDDLALTVMRTTQYLTGETRPYSLAKATLDQQKKISPSTYKLLSKGLDAASVVERLARLWKKLGNPRTKHR